MPAYVVTYVYTDDAAARDALRPHHREHLMSATELRAGGPYVGGDQPGAVLLYVAESEQAVRAITENDPFVTAGLVASWTLRAWNPVLGPAAAPLGE